MALTANTIPSQVPGFTVPFDAANAFASAQTLTATGYINNLNAVLDLGGANPVSAAGRTNGMLALDITALDVSSGDEAYQIALLGSNDAAFGNGNVELLAFHDFAATAALRVIATLLGITPAIPPVGLTGTIIYMPFTNLMQRVVYRYLKLRLIAAGTTPSITLSAWISNSGEDF